MPNQVRTREGRWAKHGGGSADHDSNYRRLAVIIIVIIIVIINDVMRPMRSPNPSCTTWLNLGYPP